MGKMGPVNLHPIPCLFLRFPGSWPILPLSSAARLILPSPYHPRPFTVSFSLRSAEPFRYGNEVRKNDERVTVPGAGRLMSLYLRRFFVRS